MRRGGPGPPRRTATSRGRRSSSGFLALAQGPHGLLAMIARRPVEDEDAVEVVHLVLDDPRLEAGRLDRDRVAGPVLRAHADVHRALDVDEDPREAQAALLHAFL